MTWVALIGPELEENLALRVLAGALNASGIGSEILTFNGSSHLVPLLDAIISSRPQPTVVALSLAFQWRAKDFLGLAVALRERGFAGHITAGGHFGSFAFERVLGDFPEVDSICRHEAERTIVDLARAVAAGRPLTTVAGLALRSDDGGAVLTPPRPPADLADLPWPDRRGEPANCLGHRIAPLVASRGCYARCAFCCIAAWHEQALPGKRYRLRPVDDVAGEMAALHHDRGIEIFIFHDDNFFLPRERDSLRRIGELAQALARRGVKRFATVVKARPNDLTRPVVTAMRDDLHCVRVFLGIESDSGQGLQTLRRGVRHEENHAAMALLSELGIYVCFNMLLFDPDVALDGLRHNLAFMERYADHPQNFGRVELYAGTPLLERMIDEGRCRGDYLGWDYDQASVELQTIYELSMRCFHERNFSQWALANRLQGTRFDVEVAAKFHPETFDPAWRDRARELSRELTLGSVAGLREIIDSVIKRRRSGRGSNAHDDLVSDLSGRLRLQESESRAAATDLEKTIQNAIGARCRHVLRPSFEIGQKPSSHSTPEPAVAQTL